MINHLPFIAHNYALPARLVQPRYSTPSPFGPRIDGTSKGPGFTAIQNENGDLMTEYSLGTPDNLYPAIYEGIPLYYLGILGGLAAEDPRFPYIQQRAWEAAIARQAQGRSPFYDGY